jgi:hypothetical protein
MRVIGLDMIYAGSCLDPLECSGHQLLGASVIAEAWAKDMERSRP